jgi:transposase
MLPPDLPLLSPSELVDRFGDDAVARRRYQLLHALVIEQQPRHTVAQRFGVSERTIRHLLQHYHGDLDALTTRRTAKRRHFWAEQALAQALQEDPNAGGDRLWRRAQNLLGDAGQKLSRRTAYRLLQQLRNEPKQPEGQLDEPLRAALPLLLEDPPLSLGHSQLARRLCSDQPDPLLRGMQLRQVLQLAIEQLRISGDITVAERGWWPYLICQGEYLQGTPRRELQQTLALSASTYTRAKRQALMRVASLLPPLFESLTIPSNPPPSLPRTATFVGRRIEQSSFSEQLQRMGTILIYGPSGSGKTALAAELAAEEQRSGSSVLWHSCRPQRESSIHALLRSLLEWLPHSATHIRQIRGMEEQVALEYFCGQIAAHPSLLVIDEYSMGDPTTDQLIQAVQLLCHGRPVQIIIISQHADLPAELHAHPLLLDGLSDSDAQLLWMRQGTTLSEAWPDIYQATAGLPRQLIQAAMVVRNDGHFGQIPLHTPVAVTVSTIRKRLIPAHQAAYTTS